MQCLQGTGAQVRRRTFVRVPHGRLDSRKPVAPQRAAERARVFPGTTGRVKSTRSRARGCTRGLGDVRFTADTYAVLESVKEQENTALEEKRKRKTGLEDHLAFELSSARILLYGSRSACGR